MRANLEQFFWTARERQEIRGRRLRGAEWPWSSDIVFQNYRFCNVFREDDRVTTWLRERVRKPLHRRDGVLLSTIIFRWFNLERTGELLHHMLVNPDLWDTERARLILKSQPPPHFTGAYVIKSPNGKTKIDGILDCVDNIRPREVEGVMVCRHDRLYKLHDWLMQFPFMGEFMAYQVVCDIRYTHLLQDARDINAWTCPGPGSARGMGWLLHDDPDRFNYHSTHDRSVLVGEMQRVLEESRDPALWPTTEPAWELSTVQHWACEYDKWRRGTAGQRLKRRFERPVEEDWRD